MSDDLVKRLREDQPVTQDMGSTAQCDLQDAAADRIEELEAKLEKAVEALDRIQHGSYGKNAAMARTALKQLTGQYTLKQLTGGKDE